MIWALPVSSAAKLAVFLSATGLLCFLTPGSARADEIYTYSGEVPTSFSITLGTTLTGLALDNLAAGTDISADLVSLMFSGPDSPPLQDGGEFPIGGSLGSGYLTETPTAVQIGTDSLGQITSWNIAFNIFASFPAVPDEDPEDFYCTYSASSTTTLDSVSLIVDNDGGLCPGGVLNAATYQNWTMVETPPATVPEPQSYIMLIGGLCLLVLAARHKRRKLVGSGS